MHLGPLRVSDGLRRQLRRRLIREQPVLIPMVHGVVNEDERFAKGALALWKPDPVRRGVPPRIPLPVDVGQTRVADVDSAVLVYALHLRRSGDIKCITADHRGELDVDEAGDERKLMSRDAGARLKIAPSERGELVFG